MTFSPSSSRVVPHALVVAALVLLVPQIVLAQKPLRGAADKGPRAVGLIEISSNGKARLIPVTIMVDGKFYDAAAYKASPVPMALETGTVYEGVLSGVSRGLFTVKSALNGVNSWRGQGTWQSEEEIKAAAARKKAIEAAEKAQAAKAKADDDNAHPVLRRGGSKTPTETGKAAPDISKTSSGTSPASPPSSAADKKDSKKDSKTDSKTASPPSSPSIPVDDENDPQRPHLRRSKGSADENVKPEAVPRRSDLEQPASKGTPVPATPPPSPASPSEMQIIPAVSDAGGPEARPYIYALKPDEEANFRKKMLTLAAVEMRTHGKPPVAALAARAGHKRTPPPAPSFDNVQLRVFDLSNSNEPVLILTATAQWPPITNNANSEAAPYLLTLVAREDIYGDLHKVVANITDSKHLDVTPKLELIDAVDVDGDGRGELLFRKASDTGSAYVVYRVIGNQLWPLFEGAIG